MDSWKLQLAVALLAVAVVGVISWLVPHPAVPVAIALAPIAAILAFRAPFLLCLLFILFTFFRLHEAFPVLNPLRIPQLLALGSLIVLGALVLTQRMRIAWSPELKLFAILFALMTLGLPVASGKDVAMSYWTDTYVKIAIMTFAIASLARAPGDFALAARAFVLAGMLVAGVAISNAANEIGLVEGTRVTIGRDIGSVLGDPNDLSLVLLFPLSFAVALVLTPRTGALSRGFGAIGAVLIMMAILETQSRGGLLGIVAVLGVFAARRIKSKAVLFGGGAVGLLGLFVAAGVGGRQSGGAAEAGAIDESAMGRLEAWIAAWRMAVGRPLTGVGLNCYVPNFYFYSDWWEGFAKAVHSTWFAVLAEGGFPAFFVFVWMCVRVVRSAMASARDLAPEAMGADYQAAPYAMAQAVLAGMAGFAVSGTFLTQAFTWPVYILLALAAATSRYVLAQAASAASTSPSVAARP
ncbi:O-antigen ligase family protein [Sediminicoccus rosea]|jgi:O-antigen ligase|uniref:O-antigen ligase family protein n=1 Tax=Sediminicoccus rosea TaxID=1225128 RepID=A0ABZ0PD61_9PROT|nr:O-antigen ligase family protein [Sediminicoccus rosea]WPB83585.1 O-antigen ligase family protein [Sediminicoccus rosea]